jgi:hypothetical protein
MIMDSSKARTSIGDIEFPVRTVGRGPDVVVLHGGPGADHSSLITEFDALARGRRLLALLYAHNAPIKLAVWPW